MQCCQYASDFLLAQSPGSITAVQRQHGQPLVDLQPLTMVCHFWCPVSTGHSRGILAHRTWSFFLYPSDKRYAFFVFSSFLEYGLRQLLSGGCRIVFPLTHPTIRNNMNSGIYSYPYRHHSRPDILPSVPGKLSAMTLHPDTHQWFFRVQWIHDFLANNGHQNIWLQH